MSELDPTYYVMTPFSDVTYTEDNPGPFGLRTITVTVPTVIEGIVIPDMKSEPWRLEIGPHEYDLVQQIDEYRA